MGWIGRGGEEGGPRCIVLAASGQTFHRPSQLFSLFSSPFFFCPRAPTSLSLSRCPSVLSSPFLLSLLPRDPPIIIAGCLGYVRRSIPRDTWRAARFELFCPPFMLRECAKMLCRCRIDCFRFLSCTSFFINKFDKSCYVYKLYLVYFI